MIQLFQHPGRDQWPELCKRPLHSHDDITPAVKEIMERVRTEGDKAVYELTENFDKIRIDRLSLSVPLNPEIPDDVKSAIDLAYHNIRKFHAAQKEREHRIRMQPGVTCWRKSVPVEKVGLYIPGGSAPLFSTLLMLAIPARLAGCSEIVVCTPPGKDGGVDVYILYTAMLLGIDTIYTVGGAQAIAAMAYGTESIPKVDKIFGPGNQYVNCAKLLAQHEGIAIDLPAGPSEVLVIADESCNPSFVAADLLSQAEHGPDSQVMLVSDSEKVVKVVLDLLETQLEKLPRKEVIVKALAHSKAILVRDLDDAMALSNTYAPEHLILATRDPEVLAEKVVNAGSVFLGHYSPESAGDYASGTNHTLPTNGYARSYSGVSLDSFVKKVTFQQITPYGLMNLGPAVQHMAAAEQLEAHKNAVTIRLNALNDLADQLPDATTPRQARGKLSALGTGSHRPVTEPAEVAVPPFRHSAVLPDRVTFDPNSLIRKNIAELTPYSSAREDFTGNANIWLDANENPFETGINRYPDPKQQQLKAEVSQLYGFPEEQIFMGNGSDEAIDLLIRAFCEPGKDRILVFTPTYGMYLTSAAIHDIEVIKIPLDTNTFDLPPISEIKETLEGVKLLFLCSPNNPTGNLLNKENIRQIAGSFEGLLILDEAYIDFTEDQGMLPELNNIPNLVILRTFSKAWGMAGIRLGMAFAHESIIGILNKIKPPYNLNVLTQEKALSIIGNADLFNKNVRMLIAEREQLLKKLAGLKNVIKVYPSQANFLLVQFQNPKEVYDTLVKKGVVVRDRTSAVPGCLRITVGTPDENKSLINVLAK